MSGELHIRVLGGFQAEIGGQSVSAEAWRRSGAAALIKLLAVTPGHRMHREQLIDVLWPDLDPSAGGRRLTKALHFARRALAAGHVQLRDDLLSLEADELWIDLDAFEAAARRGETDRALALYTGELLPENRFDEWAELPRAKARADVVRMLLDQGVERAAHGDSRGASTSFEHLLIIDPLHEEAHAHLMRLSALDGQRHVAIRRYDRLVENLREEMGVAPNADLQRLYADIVSGQAAPEQPPGSPAAEPVGRADAVAVEGEERKLVTVLTADVRLARGGRSDPERARRETATWTDALCDAVERWGGTAERPVGGGVVGVFGYPAAREDHAARALWAASEILRRLPVPVRLGIDTGEVIAPAGETPSLAGLGGDVLDVAAGLRESAQPRTVLVSDRARLAAHGEFRFGQAVQVHGFTARRLLAANWTVGRTRPESEPPMVGREDETRVLLTVIDEAAASGRPRLLTVVAGAGVGKSRLIREVVSAALERRPDIKVVRGRCLSAGDGVTYWALGEILRDACGIAIGESGQLAQRKLANRLGQLLSPLESEVEDTVFALAATAAISVPGNPLDDAPPRAVAEALAQAWPRFATALATRGPLIMVVEDLHWAGEPLLEMLVRLVGRAAGPVVVLASARPEFLERNLGFAVASADVSMISLRSLTADSSRKLLDSLPRASAMDETRRQEILTRAEGNPYFLEQLVAHVADGGSGALPDTLHALLAARVDALPAPEKRLLRAAAVVGRVFWLEPLRDNNNDVGEPLAVLERRGLVLARPTSTLAGQAEYAFKHVLLRDVAYASLPAAERARRHADVAAWLEDISKDRVGEVMELVAYHYGAAADGWDTDDEEAELITANAFRALMRAGVGARRRYAIAKAVELHRRALEYAAGIGERAEALEAVGDDHEVAFDGDAAVPAWQDAIAMLRQQPGQDERRAALCLKAALMTGCRWGGFRGPADPELTDQLVEEGLCAVRDLAARAQLLTLRALCAARWSWTGRPDPVPVSERQRAAQAGTALAERLGALPLRGFALRGMAAVHLVEGGYEDAVEAMLAQVDLLAHGGRARELALGHTIASIFLGDIRGDYGQALAHAHHSYDVARELFPHDKMHGTFFIMSCLEELGRWAEIAPYLAEHVRLVAGPEAAASCPYIRGGPLVGALAMARSGDVRRAWRLADETPANLDHPAQAEVVRARLAIELGDAATGRELAERLVRLGRRPAPEEIPHETLALVEALEALGDHDALARFLPAARAASSYLAVLAPTCDRAEGLAHAAAADVRAAEKLLRRSITGFDHMSVPLQAARTREHLARVRPDQADRLRRAALRSYTKLGAARDAARVESAL